MDANGTACSSVMQGVIRATLWVVLASNAAIAWLAFWLL